MRTIALSLTALSWLFSATPAFAQEAAAASPSATEAPSEEAPESGGSAWGPLEAVADPIREGGLTGYVSFDYFSSNRFLDDQRHFPGLNLILKSSPKFGGHLSAYVEGRLMAQDLNHPAQNGNGRTLSVGEPLQIELREGYFSVFAGDLELRAGKQIIVWGRADEINPTDWLSPRDYTLLFPEAYDARFGVVSLRADYYLTANWKVEGVWLPIPTVSTIPLPAGFSMNEQIPEIRWKNAEGAFKLDHSGGDVDFSVSYFTGFNRAPELQVVGLNPGPPPTPIPGLTHHRIQGVGGDFATTWGHWGFRGEIAYVHTKNPQGVPGGPQNPYIFYVLGLERRFLENLNVIAQYYHRYIFHHYDPQDPIQAINAVFMSQLDRMQDGLVLHVNKKFWNDTLDLDTAFVLNFQRTNFMIRPKAAYDITDEWKVSVGGEFYRGKDVYFPSVAQKLSQFGFLEKNTAAFFELRRSF